MKGVLLSRRLLGKLRLIFLRNYADGVGNVLVWFGEVEGWGFWFIEFYFSWLSDVLLLFLYSCRES